MPISPQTFADGLLPNTRGVLFTASSPSVAIQVLLGCIGGAGPYTCEIFVKRSGSSNHIFVGGTQAINQYERQTIDIKALSDGDVIEGISSDAAAIQYLISGGA